MICQAVNWPLNTRQRAFFPTKLRRTSIARRGPTLFFFSSSCDLAVASARIVGFPQNAPLLPWNVAHHVKCPTTSRATFSFPLLDDPGERTGGDQLFLGEQGLGGWERRSVIVQPAVSKGFDHGFMGNERKGRESGRSARRRKTALEWPDGGLDRRSGRRERPGTLSSPAKPPEAQWQGCEKPRWRSAQSRRSAVNGICSFAQAYGGCCQTIAFLNLAGEHSVSSQRSGRLAVARRPTLFYGLALPCWSLLFFHSLSATRPHPPPPAIIGVQHQNTEND